MKTGLAFLLLSMVIFSAMTFVFSDRTRMALAPNDPNLETSFVRASLDDAVPAAATGEPRAVAGPASTLAPTASEAAPVIPASAVKAAPVTRPPVNAAPVNPAPVKTAAVAAPPKTPAAAARPLRVASVEKTPGPRPAAPLAEAPAPAAAEPAPAPVRRPPPMQGPQL
jgi:hypothetical protein